MRIAAGILILMVSGCAAAPAAVRAGAAPDVPFVQETHEPHPIGNAAGMNDVRAIAVDSAGTVWAATQAGVFTLDKGRSNWAPRLPESAPGPAFAITVDANGIAWVGAWNGLYHAAPDGLKKIEGIEAPIAAVTATPRGIVAMGPRGDWLVHNGQAVVKADAKSMPTARSIRAVLPVPGGALWIATGNGLYYHTDSAGINFRDQDCLLSADVRDLAYVADGRLWVAGLGGITVYQGTTRVGQFTPAEGLPSIDVRCVARAPDGTMWVGTDHGAARYHGKTWSLRHSQRWLLSDQVRDVAFDNDGTAWIATAAGVSAIHRRSMTLAHKADHYLRICLARHVRPPGLVEKCVLNTPGDTSTWRPEDDDNDGQYTSMYLAMQSFRYAATKDPAAKAQAKHAFDALHFLQTVTQTPGFVARTVIPATWDHMHDPNRTFTDPEGAAQLVDDPRDKRVPVRWHPSADGKWLWKGDTSSDEITGHYFGYLCYYDLVADDPERRRVSQHVRNITDYIVDNAYILKGMDGAHTRWGVWSPEKLNHDPDWATERNVNAVEILSYLKVAHHMTGDEKYQTRYLDLIRDHGYAENARRPKTMNPSWRTHIDDELLALAFPGLIQNETDPKLSAIYRQSLDQWYAAAREDLSPYFDYTYRALSGKNVRPQQALDYLRDVSLDLVRWRVDNTRRADVRLTRYPEMERIQTHRPLPPSEICFTRWDGNPRDAVQGDGGHTESDGVFWLLPYWMGRCYGYIQPPN